MDKLRENDPKPPNNNGASYNPVSRDFYAWRSFHLGKAATQSFERLVSLLTQDIPLPSITSTTKPTETPRRKTKKINPDSNSKLAIKQSQDLNKLVHLSNDILATATTVFPFDLFPDTITVDRTKITICKRNFFWSEEVMSIRIEDVLNVATTVGPFFGTIVIASRVMSTEDHFKTDYFWRNDAIRLKHIIQGYVIAQHNNIKTSHLSRNELIDTLAGLGHDSI